MASPFVAWTEIGISPPGDEDRQINIGGGELALKIEPTLAGKEDIEHDRGGKYWSGRSHLT